MEGSRLGSLCKLVCGLLSRDVSWPIEQHGIWRWRQVDLGENFFNDAGTFSNVVPLAMNSR